MKDKIRKILENNIHGEKQSFGDMYSPIVIDMEWLDIDRAVQELSDLISVLDKEKVRDLINGYSSDIEDETGKYTKTVIFEESFEDLVKAICQPLKPKSTGDRTNLHEFGSPPNLPKGWRGRIIK